VVEWDLNPRRTEIILRPLLQRKVKVSSTTLHFYCSAYAAFRMGFTLVGANQASFDSAEKHRLLGASEWYKRKLAHLLSLP
jgi:hypothetical protein